MTASVVIPAHDDAQRVVRCVESLLAEARPDEFQIVVVANGCSDDTVARVEGLARPDVTCLELAEAAKPAALNAGDDAVSGFPRIYLDADVILSTAAARALVSVLSGGDVLAAAPRVRHELAGVGPLARRYLKVLASLPAFSAGYVGSGCYAVSANGRARFSSFPDLIGDDRFVNGLFRASEKSTLRDQHMVVSPPRNLRSIVRRSLRVRAGSLAVDALAPDPSPGEQAAGPSTARHLLSRLPRDPVGVLVFASVQVVVEIGSRWRRQRGTDRTWLRDESSRSALS